MTQVQEQCIRIKTEEGHDVFLCAFKEGASVTAFGEGKKFWLKLSTEESIPFANVILEQVKQDA